ncbi:MAG TPA: hypothetical protein VGG74_14175 [Kofleriaceae bacterium]|jgi:hypothetical protein
MTLRNLAFASIFVLAASCGKSDNATPPAPAGQPAAQPAAAAPVPAAPTPAVAQPAADVEACSLISAADVGKIFDKTVVSSGSGQSCNFGLDPAQQQQAMAALQQDPAKAAAAMAKGGKIEIPSAISNQLQLDVSIDRDAQTEAELKAGHAQIGKTIGATKPGDHGLNGTNETAKDISGVGDWAFSVNVAAVNMGMGMSTRGRMLEAHQGPWHLTVSVTIAPDPGEAKLDEQLAAVARAACAKLH